MQESPVDESSSASVIDAHVVTGADWPESGGLINVSSAQELNREQHWLCARRLCERRHQLGLTQLDVVSRLRQEDVPVTNRAISAMENGQAVDAGRLAALARALECSVTYLLGLTDDPHQWHPDPGRWRRSGRAVEDAAGA